MKVDALFRATADIDLPGGTRGMVRALSDGEREERRRYALLRSLEVQRELGDETSDRHKMDIAPLADTDSPNALASIILEVRQADLQSEAITLYQDQYIPFPEKATDAEQRATLEERERTEAETQKQRREHVRQRAAEIYKKLLALPIEKLRAAACKAAVDVYARREMLRAATRFTVWAGAFIYEDQEALANPKRLFESPEQVMEAPPDVINRLLVEVDRVDGVDVWEIQKNSLTGSGTASSA